MHFSHNSSKNGHKLRKRKQEHKIMFNLINFVHAINLMLAIWLNFCRKQLHVDYSYKFNDRKYIPNIRKRLFDMHAETYKFNDRK